MDNATRAADALREATEHRRTLNHIWRDAAHSGGSLDTRQAARVREITERAEAAEERADALIREAERESRARSLRVQVPANSRSADNPYAAGEASFFGDLVASRLGDSAASARIASHDEMRREQLIAEGETRLTTTTSAGAFSPVQYLGRQYAGKRGSGRVYTSWLGPDALPAYGMEVQVPVFPTLPDVAAQAAEGSAIATATITAGTAVATVRTFAGRVRLSRQAIERTDPALDGVIGDRLQQAYDAAVEFAALSGSGSPSFTGALSYGTADGASVVSMGSADTATGTAFIRKIAEGISTLNAAEFEMASGFFMSPRRWARTMSYVDGSSRPYVSPIAPATGRDAEDTAGYGGPVGYLFGIPVWTSGGVSLTFDTDKDKILLTTRSAARLWETGGGVPQRVTVDVNGGEDLEVNLVAYGYGAYAVPQPSGLVVFEGAGMGNPFA